MSSIKRTKVDDLLAEVTYESYSKEAPIWVYIYDGHSEYFTVKEAKRLRKILKKAIVQAEES
jgi:hypothetical protein